MLLEACEQPLRDLVTLILDTGMRVGEALSLKWSDVLLAGNRPAIRIRKGKTAKAVRTLDLTSRAQQLLAGREGETESEWVFPGRGLNPESPLQVTSADHMFRKTCDGLLNDAGKALFPREFVLHSLRHTFLTRIADAGAGAFEIMKIAGHANITTSQRYIHPSDESVQRAFVRLNAANDAFEIADSEGALPHSLPQWLPRAA